MYLYCRHMILGAIVKYNMSIVNFERRTMEFPDELNANLSQCFEHSSDFRYKFMMSVHSTILYRWYLSLVFIFYLQYCLLQILYLSLHTAEMRLCYVMSSTEESISCLLSVCFTLHDKANTVLQISFQMKHNYNNYYPIYYRWKIKLKQMI